VVNILIFILGCFIDFFEIAFIVIPILAPVAEKILPGLVPGMTADQAMIWFGVIVAMNLQTSFLTPPFGFALFYLRSVAPKNDYKDRITGENIPAVKTSEIYKGSIAFIVLQLIMVASIIAFPNLVTGGLKEGVKIDADAAFEQMLEQKDDQRDQDEAMSMDDLKPTDDKSAEEDPAKALEADMKASKK
jgi:TRAP-type mannitol/chloroaromatic compound transport system permease large subunit